MNDDTNELSDALDDINTDGLSEDPSGEDDIGPMESDEPAPTPQQTPSWTNRLLNTEPNPPIDSVESPISRPDAWLKYIMRGLKKSGIPVDSAIGDFLQGGVGLMLTQANEKGSSGDSNDEDDDDPNYNIERVSE